MKVNAKRNSPTGGSIVDARGSLGQTVDIEFLAQGAFNKVFVLRLAGKEVIARVTLPVDPGWKTLSEVATLAPVDHNTSLPAPEVLSFQAGRASTIGFEWIAMSRMPGTSPDNRWRDITFSAKEQIARRLALFCSETFRVHLQESGRDPVLSPGYGRMS